ncbi:MAG: hypothetical protein H0X39_09380 [Actinobacteria bacterium]|nr:hypothetical protein [Actinomycetota bacterium]
MEVTAEFEAIDRGSQVTVTFGDGSSQPDVRSLFDSPEHGLDRLEYICRTRTALGYFRPPDLGGIHPALLSLRVEFIITFSDGERVERILPEGERHPGFLFPHEMARRRGSFNSQFTDPRPNSELLYGFFDAAFFAAHLPDVWANHSYRALIERFALTGYFSYGYRNTYYEDITGALLGLAEEGGIDEAFPQIDLIQVNGGFQIAVREYPNGRRHSFLHRSGAEDKSRTFVIFNFRGDYKPDYGRKNIADEVRPLVLDVSKALIQWATRSPRKGNLVTGEEATPYGATGIDEARETLADDAERFALGGAWLDATIDPPERLRVSKAEAEVVSEFVSYVASGHLPGFRIYGLSSRMLDSMFDYHLELAEQYVYDETGRPLGLIFIEGRDRHYERQWLEFKPSTDMLVADIAADAGSAAKKWFTTISLLVCENVDDALDGYTIDAITADNTNERKYFGVTHILRSHANQDHAVQVIALSSLRLLLGGGSVFVPPRNTNS